MYIISSALNFVSHYRYRFGHYNRIVNIDLSTVVIKQQAEKYPEQQWKVMNATNMDFGDKSFDAVIDKSLIDTLMCGAQR